MKFDVEITETLQKVISIDADDEQSAIIATRQLYRVEDVVLDSSDYIDTVFEILSSHR